MPTHHDETLPQRYEREHQAYLKLCGSMTAEQVADLQLQLNNSMAREQALQALLTAADERADVLTNALNEAERVLGCYAPPTHKALKLISAALKLADGGGDEYRKSCEAAHKALSMENQRITPVQTETREDAIERLFGRFGDGE